MESSVSGSYTCNVCGEAHTGAPLSWGPDAPDMWARLRPSEREQRVELGSDQCIIDERHFFIRGRIEIPVRDGEDPFAWLVWVEISRTDFESMGRAWAIEGRENTEPPYNGILANDLSHYSNPTLGLPVRIHTRSVGVRPFVEIIGDHQIQKEQREGINSHHVQEIADKILGS